MKIIHNNQKNISVYHLLSLHIHENIEDYYLENCSGRILSHEELVKDGEKYTIKEKCRGGTSLNNAENSIFITIGSSIFYGIVTILYYNYYITNILKGSSTSANTKIPGVFTDRNISKSKENEADNSKKTGFERFKFIMKQFFNRFTCHIKDTCYESFVSNSFPYKKETIIKNNQTSLGSILSFAIFAVFIFMILAPLFLNTITKIACGKPKVKNIFFALIFIFLPLVICKLIPNITLLIENIAKKYGKTVNIQNYKIAISNTILLGLLIVYMFISKNGLSKMMYGMFPIAFIVFIGIKFIPIIPDIIHVISKFISNNITNISPPVGDNKPEEARRYTFFYQILEMGFLTIIAWVLYTIAYIGQIKEYCPT